MSLREKFANLLNPFKGRAGELQTEDAERAARQETLLEPKVTEAEMHAEARRLIHQGAEGELANHPGLWSDLVPTIHPELEDGHTVFRPSPGRVPMPLGGLFGWLSVVCPDQLEAALVAIAKREGFIGELPMEDRLAELAKIAARREAIARELGALRSELRAVASELSQ